MPKKTNLSKILGYEKREIEDTYGKQDPLAEISAKSEPSWIIQKVGPSHLLLHEESESVVTSEEHLTRVQDANRLILINEIFYQLHAGEENLLILKGKITDFKMVLEKIKHRFSEDLEKLESNKVDTEILLTLVHNCIKEMERFSFQLDKALKEGNYFISHNQEVINKCCELFFAPSIVDDTLSSPLKLINDEIEETLKKSIFQFKKDLSQKQMLIEQGKPTSPIKEKLDSPVLDSISLVQEAPHIPLDSDKQTIENLLQEIELSDEIESLDNASSDFSVVSDIYDLEEIELPIEVEISAQDDVSLKLYQVSDINQYVKIIALAIKKEENLDLFEKLINYRSERLAAIDLLNKQLALSLALGEPEEKITLLYHWIEICRGKSPKDRIIIPGVIDRDALNKIHQSPVLNEIYFKLPHLLQADLSHDAEDRGLETRVIDSVRSIDDPNPNSDQILLRWSNFISQEKVKLRLTSNFSCLPESLVLMHSLNMRIVESPNIDAETIALWKQQLKAAYKLYQVELGIPAEKRLLTQEPLTEEEYQLIQNHPSFSSIFRTLGETHEGKLCLERLLQEQYRSILIGIISKDEGAPINTHGLLEHNKDSTTELLIEKGESEFLRGSRFLIGGEFLQNKIRYGFPQKLVTILMEKGFSQDEAESTVGFVSEQRVYYIFSNLLASRANAVKQKTYSVKESPDYVNIYKSNGTIYFEVTSGPWSFMCIDDERFLPKQPPKTIGNFFDAKFILLYKLIPGLDVKDDVLRLVDVTTDSYASWQLLNFDSPEWNALPVIQRYIKDIELVMQDLRASDPQKRRAAKSTIEQWLSNESDKLHLKDYELIETHLKEIISEVPILSLGIGESWLSKTLACCAHKIKIHKQRPTKLQGKERELLLSELAMQVPFDLQAVGRHLICEIDTRVEPAKLRIEYFLGEEAAAPGQYKALKDFLSPLLQKKIMENLLLDEMIDSDSIAKNTNMIDWLKAQIIVCNSHIAAANDEAFDVTTIVSALMIENTRAEAMNKINIFLMGSTRDRAKCSALAERLTTYKSGLQAKGNEDQMFIRWLNNAIDSAMGGAPESKARLSSSSSSSLDRRIEQVEKQDRFFSSSSSSMNAAQSIERRTSHFFSKIEEGFSRLSRKGSGADRQSPPKKGSNF